MGSKQKSTKSAGAQLDSSIYLLEWSRSAFQSYTQNVNELYLKELVEHCTGRKVEETLSSHSDEAEHIAKGPKVEDKSDTHSIRQRLKDAASRQTDWEGEPPPPSKLICIAELSAMHRLTALVRSAGQLLEQLQKTEKWSNENFKLLGKHRKSLNVLDFAKTMFEATCSIADVFKFIAVNRKLVKEEHSVHLRKIGSEEYDSKVPRVPIEIGGDPAEYIPPLEAMINYFRAIIHLIGTALISIIQSYLRCVPQEQIDLRTRETNEILDSLPPMYLRVPDIKVSKYVSKLLSNPPPNKRSYPIAPKMNESMKTHRSGKAPHSLASRKSSKKSNRSQRSHRSMRDSGKVSKKKFKNPIDKSEKSQSSKKEKSDSSAKNKGSKGKGDSKENVSEKAKEKDSKEDANKKDSDSDVNKGDDSQKKAEKKKSTKSLLKKSGKNKEESTQKDD